MYSLTVPEARSLQSKCWWSRAASDTCRGGAFLASSSIWQGHPVFASLWLAVAACRSSSLSPGLLPSVCLCAQIPSSFKDTNHIGLGPTQMHLNLFTDAKTLFLNKIKFTDLGGLQYIFYGGTFQPTAITETKLSAK